MTLSKLTPAEIADALATHGLRRWAHDGISISRIVLTRDWRSTMMLANLIAHTCEAAWHHPQLTLTYAQIVIRLDTHDVHGVSLRDIELAKRLDALLEWDGKGDALEGVPQTQSLLR